VSGKRGALRPRPAESGAPDVPGHGTGHDFRRVVFDQETIARRVTEMGRDIAEAHAGSDDLLVLGLLKGSFIFVADLVRTIPLPLQIDFVVASSYGTKMASSGEVSLLYESDTSLEGRSVILVEDIIDSGTTMNRLIPLLSARGPRTLEVCALLHKRLVKLEVEPRWVGFEAPDEFLVGYGLDYSENFRHLPFIASL
jgi:hypoxanthine phosphoribosyltransferase